MATQETPLFKIHDATVRRKEKVILHVDDFELAEGENIALLGPNGAGKSTFIQLLTREVLPLHRDVPPVIFRGQERPSLADIKACFGVVSNTMHDQVRVHLPARDIVCGGLFGTLGIPRHVHATEADFKKAEEQLERLGIGDRRSRREARACGFCEPGQHQPRYRLAFGSRDVQSRSQRRVLYVPRPVRKDSSNPS